MARKNSLNRLFSFLMIASLFFSAIGTLQVQAKGTKPVTPTPVAPSVGGSNPAPSGTNITVQDRQAAAASNTAKGLLPGVAGKGIQSNVLNPQNSFSPNILNAPAPQITPIDETVVPHYFGPYANYANSPLPTGEVSSITVDTPGSGYTSPNVIITDAYGTGVNAIADAVLDVNGGIASITVIDPGTGYTAPVVVITDVTGTGATATPNLGGTLSGGIRKFIDSVAGLGAGAKNNLGNYISVGHPDTITFPGSDYYEIELVEFKQQMHTDLPKTTLRGYHQVNKGTDASNQNTIVPDPVMYLGTTIVARRNVPVRIKFMNHLGTGTDGDLFLPVNPNVMGAGYGPLTADGTVCDADTFTNPNTGIACVPSSYTQNRATLHLHGGLVPWISDGTPHQWTSPAGEVTQYPKGVSVQYVPDMWFDPITHAVVPAGTANATNNPGDGSLTFYYNNQQSARLQFYHDHAYGITRLNVYAGEAAGYLVTDDVEQDLINGTNFSGVNPGNVSVFGDMGLGIPLIIQDKTFVDETTIAAQDPTWRWGTGVKDGNGRPKPNTGDLWLPHVYMTIQNPWDAATGANAFGRWQYGPWFFPPTGDVIHQPVPNEYYDPNCDSMLVWCEPPYRPDSPEPSMGAEAFMDTPTVNGVAYPFMDVQPKPYRFRFLNAANDRFFNLQMYVADPSFTSPVPGVGNTEVKMVDAILKPGYPANFPNDGRAGGAPDPAMAGPAWIQIGTEGGFLPAPVVIPNQPITWQMNPGLFNVGNALDHSLLLGAAERADVIVDFTAYAGKTIILYNDAPAAFPALDPRYDYYTGDSAQMDSGGTTTTMPGFGPNTRTVMQFRVSGTPLSGPLPTNYYNPAVLDRFNAAWAHTSTGPNPHLGVFETAQDKIIVPQAGYDSAYGQTFPSDMQQYVQISDLSKTFTPVGATQPVTINFKLKAMHDEMGAAYDLQYGQMSGYLGIEIPNTTNLVQNIILYGYASPPVEVLKDSGLSKIGELGDGTQIWKIIHNGVDTHPIHFHLVNVQVINRVAWDGLLLPPDANELGWKETVRVNPLESAIVAFRPAAPVQPFELPDSIRYIEPTRPEGVPLMGPPGGFLDAGANAITVTNHLVNYGWEYVWHCHILSHEEMDMMHSMAFAVAPWAPTALAMSSPGVLTWNDNSIAETGYRLERATDSGFSQNLVTILLGANVTTTTDPSYVDGTHYYYRLFADNTIGDTTSYAPGAPFPTETASSVSNTLELNPISTVVISGNTGVGAVTLSYTDITAKTVVSDALGAYSITLPVNWTGTVTPSKVGGYTFGPQSINYSTPLSANQTAQNYSVFTKTAPFNLAIGQTTTPTLSWTAFTGAASYDYCADTTNDNACDPASPSTSTGWVNVSAATLNVSPTLLNATTYYWQVRAVNPDATTVEANASTWWSFSTTPVAFGKNLPATASYALGTSVTLSWNPSPGADAYYYCYDMTNNATCDIAWIRAGTSNSVTVNGLIRGKSYYWQVRAQYKTAATFADNSTWWSFSMGQPADFSKLAPASGAINLPLTPTISWAASLGATGYEYCYDTSNDNTCNSGIWTGTGANRTATLSGLTNDTTYYWQVRSIVGAGTVDANANVVNRWWSFTTHIPGQFGKTAPTTGYVGASPTSTSLTWGPSASALSYEYCLDDTLNNTCDSGIWVSTLTSQSVIPAGLTFGKTYQWQVRAVNGSAYTYADGGTWWSYSSRPGNFNKMSPATGSTNVILAPTITWGVSTGVSQYEYCIDTTNNNTCDSGIWILAGLNQSVSLSGLASNTTYYWHVRSMYAGGYYYSNADTWYSFTTVNTAFAKTAPAEFMVGTSPTATVLTWGSSPSATSYEYCLDETNNNTCDTGIWTSTGTNRSVTPAGLTFGKTYYWQVRAVNGGPYTEANAGSWWSYSTRPGNFNKTSPTNGAINIALTPTLWWGGSTGATAYEYCYDTTPNNICDSGIWTSTGATLSATLSGLSINTTYYWQVRSVYNGGYYYANGAATWWSFTTINPAFNKLTPANLAVGLSLTPTMTWGPSAGATSYEYCFDTTPNNTCDSGIWTSTGTSQTVILSGLAYNTTYYWHVRSIYSGGYSYSDADTWWAFSTIGTAFNKTSPTDLTVGASPTATTLTWGTSASATSYEYCLDQTNNNTCDSGVWTSTGLTRSVTPAGLTFGKTYYWQVRAISGALTTDANGGTWWSYSTRPGNFNKISPTNGAINVSLTPTLWWGASTGATSYEYCFDTTNNSTCDSGVWTSSGAVQNAAISGLTNTTTYYWQVRSVYNGGYYYANGTTTWWAFTTP